VIKTITLPQRDLFRAQSGLAYVDITTGEFFATDWKAKTSAFRLRAELIRLHPAEIFTSRRRPPPYENRGFPHRPAAWRFEANRCKETLLKHFQVAALDGFGLREMSLAVRAAGALVQYLQETQPEALSSAHQPRHLLIERIYDPGRSHSANLELTETIRGGDEKGSAAACARTAPSSPWETPDDPVGQQTLA
jgi:DNA mismatch repair protein MutS